MVQLSRCCQSNANTKIYKRRNQHFAPALTIITHSSKKICRIMQVEVKEYYIHNVVVRWHKSKCITVVFRLFAFAPITSQKVTFQLIYLIKVKAMKNKFCNKAIRQQISKSIKILIVTFLRQLSPFLIFHFLSLKRQAKVMDTTFAMDAIRRQISKSLKVVFYFHFIFVRIRHWRINKSNWQIKNSR